jgi:PAS domain-containing protein
MRNADFSDNQRQLQSGQIFSQAFNCSPIAMSIIHVSDNRLVEANNGFLNLFEFDRNEVVGKNTKEVNIFLNYDLYEEILGSAADDQVYKQVMVAQTKSRKIINVLFSLAFFNINGEKYALTTTEISDQSNNDRNAWLASFPEHNPNPVLEVDLEGKITYTNPAAKKLFSTLVNSGVEHPFLADIDKIICSFRTKTVKTFCDDVEVDKKWYRRQFYMAPNNRYVRIYAADVTEEKKAEEARVETQKKLEENACVV